MLRPMTVIALLAIVSPAFTALEASQSLTGERWERARQKLRQAKREAQAIPDQARALAGLAWPAEEPTEQVDVDARVLARAELVGFAKHGMGALRESVKQVAPRHQADVVTAIIQAQRRIRSGIPPELFPALDEAVWFGAPEAKRLAMRELARFGYRPSVLSIVDAARQHPELAPTAIHTLGVIGDPRAQHYLGQVLDSAGTPRERRLAASALARIGDVALQVLRDASRSERASVRETAIEALLPRTGLDDLTVLHEYVGFHGDDDAELLDRVRARALYLEELLEQQRLDNAGVEP